MIRFFVIAASLIVGDLALAADQFVYQRNYELGEHYEYTLNNNYYLNAQWQNETIGLASLTVGMMEDFLADQVQWKSLLKKDANGSEDLTGEAKKVDPYFMSLQPNGPLKVPALKVQQMIGMITDLLTFFVAVSPHVGTPNVNSADMDNHLKLRMKTGCNTVLKIASQGFH